MVITGYLKEEELYSILDGAKGLIYPSLFEGFGIPVVEAMHLYKPIACSSLTSLPEIGCSSIHYFNPKKPDEIYDGIAFLYRAKMTDTIRLEYDQKLKAFETDHMVSEYLKLFRETVEDHAAHGFQEGCFGVYQDGWSSGQIEIFIKGKKGNTLEIQGTYPSFAGKKLLIRETIRQDRACISLTVAKAWIPAVKLKNADQRKLGMMLHEIAVEEADGKRTALEIQADG